MSKENEHVHLTYVGGGSDKVYHAYLVDENLFGVTGWKVYALYGRRGSTLNRAPKGNRLDYGVAKKIFDKLVNEKVAKGYRIVSSSVGAAAGPYTPSSTPTPKLVVEGLMLMNAIECEADLEPYITSARWVMQEKYDGQRRMIRKLDGIITGINRKGEIVELPVEMMREIYDIPEDNFCIDGEILGDDYRAFDIIRRKNTSLNHRNYQHRYANLKELLNLENLDHIMLTKSQQFMSEKRDMFERLQKEGREGVVFKNLNGVYKAGKLASGGNVMKYKFYETASFVVGDRNIKRSVQLLLYNLSGTQVDVGNVTIPPNHEVPDTGDIIEVRYLYAYYGGSVYQPTYLGVRNDIDFTECTMSQLKYKRDV